MTLEEGDVGEAAGATAQDAAAGEPRGAMLGVRYRTTDEILAHPGFPAARIVYIDRTLSVYDKASFPAGLVADAARTTVFGTLICIDAAHAEGDRGTWATLKRLKETVTQFGFLSPRQVDDLVGQLRARGYVDIVPFAQDGRMRLLRPTGKLLAWDRDFLSAYYTPLEMLYPEPGYAPAVRRDPAFQTAHRRSALDMFPITARFIAENADVLPFLGANSGVPLLMALSQMGAEEADSRIREVDLAGMRALRRLALARPERPGRRGGGWAAPPLRYAKRLSPPRPTLARGLRSIHRRYVIHERSQLPARDEGRFLTRDQWAPSCQIPPFRGLLSHRRAIPSEPVQDLIGNNQQTYRYILG